MKRALFLLALAVFFLPRPAGAVEVRPAFGNLAFEKPLDIQSPRDGSNRLFVVEQRGVIRVFRNDPHVRESKVFLDIRDRVLFDDNEMGLLGLAFDPGFGTNGLFYVNYNAAAPMRTVIACFRVGLPGSDEAMPESGRVLLEIAQPYTNHKGGQLAFGPDGYLYIGMGDGGSAGDPHGNAQNMHTLLGKMLRIDVKNAPSGKRYGIPADNPYAAIDQKRDEIWAHGLRNPWRFSWDRKGRLWAADVGQHQWEEIHWIEKGKNYGWNVLEGSHCFNPPENCDTSGLETPVLEYDHDQGRCVIGGFVYRGAAGSLKDKYVFADFVSGRIWAFAADSTGRDSLQVIAETKLPISSFGEDEAGELYFAAFDGKIYKFAE